MKKKLLIIIIAETILLVCMVLFLLVKKAEAEQYNAEVAGNRTIDTAANNIKY